PSSGGKGLAITGMVLAIIGAVLCFIPFVVFFGIFVAVAGLVIGIIALVKKANGRGMSLAAVIVGGVATLIGIGMIILTFITIAAFGQAAEELERYYEENPEMFEQDPEQLQEELDDLYGDNGFDFAPSAQGDAAYAALPPLAA